MLHELLRIPIVEPSVLAPVDILAVLFVVAVFVVRPGAARPATARPGAARPAAARPGATRPAAAPVRRTVVVRSLTGVGAMTVGAVVGLVVVWQVGDVHDAFGVAFTPVTRMWVAFLFAAVGLAVVVLVQGGSARRVLAIGALSSVALASGLGINVDFGAYRNLEQVIVPDPVPVRSLGTEHAAAPGATVVDAATWTPPADMPARGETITVDIPATVSHFPARPAVVWLPPAARVADPPTLPVIVALSGQPGEPSDMFTAGDLGATLDAYAAAHHGLAPIVVAPDQLGAPNRNPMCLDTAALGQSETYLMTDSVDWIRAHLDVADGANAWSIAGFSEGATCAMQLSARFPGTFGSALAISSELAPVTGSVRHTVDVAFGGSTKRYDAATPVAIMARKAPYSDHLTVFAYGSADRPYAASTATLRAAAIRAGMTTKVEVSPGSAHDWVTVRYAITHGLPSIIAHEGLPQ
jgi:enterochelin esterase-like enzyme